MAEPIISKGSGLERREFLKITGGFLLAVTIPTVGNRTALAQGSSTSITIYLRIGSDETITVLVGGGEMGQGIYTGLAMGAAEELKVLWTKVKVEPIAASLSWLSAGSGGIKSRLPAFLTAGAAAREMLIDAAAQTWSVDRSLCQAIDGTIKNTATGQTLTYGQLAPLAATLPVPVAPPLTPSSAYKIIGTPATRPDLPSKTNGSAKYGIDAVVPGMAFAIIKHCPTMGGTLKTTPSVPPGASAVVPLDNAYALVSWLPGANTWGLIEAAKQISGSIWNNPADAALRDSTVFQTQAMNLLGRGAPYVAEQVGDVAAGFANAAQVVEATYTLPYLPHACMEVLNCTVRMTPLTPPYTGCEVWAPTQAPKSVLTVAATTTGLAQSAVTVYPMLMGGGLGRKFELPADGGLAHQDRIGCGGQHHRLVEPPGLSLHSRPARRAASSHRRQPGDRGRDRIAL